MAYFHFPAGVVDVLGPTALKEPWVCAFSEKCEVKLKTTKAGTLEAAYSCGETADAVGRSTRAEALICDDYTSECVYAERNL